MVDDLIRLYDKDAKPKAIKSNSNKKSTTVLKGSNAENWMISKNVYSPRIYGNVETSLNSLIGEYSQNHNINNGAVNFAVSSSDKIFSGKSPSYEFTRNMFKIGITDRFKKQTDKTIREKNVINPDEYPGFPNGKTELVKNGITFKKLEDGSISANGICTGPDAVCQVKIYSSGNNAKYLISGCPPGGSSTTYYIEDTNYPYYDYGDGCVTTNLSAYSIWIYIKPGIKVKNLIFRPQLYNLTDMFGAGNEPNTPEEFYAPFIKYYCNFAWIDYKIFADETKNTYGVMPEVPKAVASATVYDKWLYIKFFDEALKIGDHKFVDGASLNRLLGPYSGVNFGGFDIKFSFYSYKPKIFYTQMFQNEAWIEPSNYNSDTKEWNDGFVLKKIVVASDGKEINKCKRFTPTEFETKVNGYSDQEEYDVAYTLDEFGGLYLFCPNNSYGGSYKWLTDKNANGDAYDSIAGFTRALSGKNITVEYNTVTLKDEWGGLGLGVLSEISSPLVKRELNGEYEFSFTYPVTGRHFNELKPRAIVVTKPSANENPQGFRIYKTTKPINGQITVNCQHISYDQSGIFAIPFATQVSESGSSLYSSDDMISSLIGAASKISPDSEFAKPGRIKVEGGKVLVNQQFYSDDPKSLRSLIGADDGSILSILGGDVVFDNFKTTFYPKGYGNKTGFSIRYGKNMTEYSEEEDESGAYSRVYPFWKPKNSTSTSSSNLDNYKINPAYSAGANISGSSNTDSVLSSPGKTFTMNVDLSQYAGQDTPFKSYLIDFMKNGGHLDTNTILESPDKTERYIYNGKGALIDPNESTQETAETTDETNYLDLDGYSRIAGTKATIEGEEYVSLLADGRIVVADQENIDNPYFKTMTLDLSDAFENKGLLTYDSIDNFPKPSEITKTQAKCIFSDSSKSRKYLYDPFKDSGTKDKDGHVIYGAYIDYSGTPDKNALYLEAYWYIVENDLAKPKVTFTLSYVELYRNKDASALSVLEQVNLGDTIKIKMNLYNTDVDVKCTGMSYNPVSKRVESITVGTPKKDLASTISEQTEKISKTPDKKTVSTLVDSTIAPALQVTTSLITGNTGGFAMLYNSRTGKTSTTPKATTAWATMNEDGKSGIPFRTYDEMYNFVTNLEGGISDDILFKYAPGVKKADGMYDYTNAPVYDFTWSSRLLRARIFDIKFINGTGQDEGLALTFNSILFNPEAWQNSLEYNPSIDGTSYRQYSFSREYVLAYGSGAKFTAMLNGPDGSSNSVLFSFGIDKNKDGKLCFFVVVSKNKVNKIYESDAIDFRTSQGYDSIKIKLTPDYKEYTHDASENIDDIGVVWSSGFEKYNQDISAPDEFLIMNTNDINTATQVWRWNKSGLMFSKSEKPGDAYFGFNSEIPLAMDMNGQIIAQRINADQLEINDVTVNNGLYLRGKRAEKLFLSKSGFTTVSPAEGSDYIKYHFSDNEEKILPPENEHLTYFSTDFDAKWGNPFEGEIYNKNDEKIADIFLISYSDFITGSGITSQNRNYAAITDVGDLLFKLYEMDYSDIGSYFNTHTIKIVYPTYNNVSFYSEAGISSIFNGEIYASVLGGAHFDGHGTVSCMIYNQVGSNLTDINIVSVEQGTKTKFELKYTAYPGKSNIQKPDSTGDFYSWSDSDGGTIPLKFYVKGDPSEKFAYIPVPNTVVTGKNYTGSVVVNYQIGNIISVRPASNTEEHLAPGPLKNRTFLVQSPTAIIRLPGHGLKPYMFFKGSLRAHDETSSIGYIDKDTNTENRFSIGCFEVINTNSCIVNNDITVNDIKVNGSISFGPTTEGANTPTNINNLIVSSRDAMVSKIDLSRSAIYNPNGTIKELTDSEGGLIKFPFIDGQNTTLHAASGGAFYIGFSEYNFTSGAAPVKLPCLVIYWYLNGAWRPKYRFRLSDIANYDDSGALNGWVPNTAK